MSRRLRVTPDTVRTWRRRFLERGLDGLSDEPRPGVPRKIADAWPARAPAYAPPGTHARSPCRPPSAPGPASLAPWGPVNQHCDELLAGGGRWHRTVSWLLCGLLTGCRLAHVASVLDQRMCR
ncbi:helix-turn-helix domain-containing protein [Streptomyces javensis]|uniref:helix-turn-helix domain-containing protein n=1 Tax=Streptomyces javensis TaxID=114698 RepID=UPI0033F7B7FA